MTFNKAIELARSIVKRFEKIEGKPWKAEGSMIELSKQLGELAKLIMVQEKYYFNNRNETNNQYETNKEKIGDEMADILYALVRLADHYDIDLLQAHIKAREAEDEFLKTKGV